jgi:hypothetical protein
VIIHGTTSPTTNLRVVARLCFKHFHFSIWGLSIPKAEFEAIADGEALIPEILQKPDRHHCTWHPEDYGLAANESKVAKEADTLAPLLEWIKSENLPSSVKKAIC